MSFGNLLRLDIRGAEWDAEAENGEEDEGADRGGKAFHGRLPGEILKCENNAVRYTRNRKKSNREMCFFLMFG